ncbi:MAG TPA: LysR family transcriptional regulator, partial [Lysobacter sp.]
MLDLQQLSSFLAVVRAGSFVGAAEAAGLSKAAVSRHVAELEAHLGVRLLHRTTRRLSLTEDGQRFHAQAAELVAALEELEAETASRGGEATGRLRVNAPLTFGNLHLAPLWPRFLAAHPNVSLDITLNDRVVDLVEEGYDVAIRITARLDPQLVSRRLATTRIVLCASPRYLAAHGTPVHPHELAAHAVFGYSYWSGGDNWSFHGPDGEVTVRVNPRIHTNSGDTCRAAALDGQGIVLQPDFLVGPDLNSGALVELMPAYRSIELGVFAVYATRKHLPMKTRRLIDFLAEAFARPAWQRGGHSTPAARRDRARGV